MDVIRIQTVAETYFAEGEYYYNKTKGDTYEGWLEIPKAITFEGHERRVVRDLKINPHYIESIRIEECK